MQSKKKPVSYRRNRDYTKTFEWNYELKNDLYECYLKAKEDPRIGYVKRMKTYWDQKHPELAYFTDKNLRDQASRIEKGKIVMATEFNSNLVTANDNLATNTNDNYDEPTDNNIVNDTTHDEVILNNDIPPEENHELEYIEIKNKLEPIFLENLVIYNRLSIEERVLTTKNKKNPSDTTINVINDLSLKYLLSLNNPNYWDINITLYTAAVTIKHSLGESQEKTTSNIQPKIPYWISQLENKINRIRRNIGQLNTLIDCKIKNSFTNHQMSLKSKFFKKYGNCKKENMEYRLTLLKQELKANAEKLRYKRKLHQKKILNRKFASDQKSIYRSMKGKNIKIALTPTKDEIHQFWKNIWGKETTFNDEALWLNDLNDKYCKNVEQKTYEITSELLESLINKIQNNKSPGRDLICGFWFKKLSFYRKFLARLFQKCLVGKENLPDWLILASTVLLPKNENTSISKNYRPIACLNIMYKLYTSCLNTFLQEHCSRNNIITDEQAGGKKKIWGCAEQLLLNKAVMKEVKDMRRNLVTVWLDYQKAFDSVPHSWLIHSLRLANTPPIIINAILSLTKSWSTIVTLKGMDASIITEEIKFRKGIFQGDSLSVILFILSMNPLSFMLKRLEGYKIGKERQGKITHNFFVDDLKLYGSNVNIIKKQLDLVTTFSKDIGMAFGQEKCAYLNIAKGKIINTSQNLVINGLQINPIEEGSSYKYLGQDENISYVGEINKERSKKEYFSRIKKIWSSELSAFNKMVAHNTFAVPVLIPTFGILDWTIQEIDEIDIKTRKILCYTNNFHPNSDIDKLYLPRKSHGRGLRSIRSSFECRIISLRQHLEKSKERNILLNFVTINENNNIIRVGKELLQRFDIEDQINESPRGISQKYNLHLKRFSEERYKDKVMHGYFYRKIQDDPNIDHSLSNQWRNDKYITSHFEGYACAIEDQEIPTKYLINKREKDSGKQPTSNNKCRLCMNAVEDVVHILSGCPEMSARYYLTLRHDVVGKALYQEILKLKSPSLRTNRTFGA